MKTFAELSMDFLFDTSFYCRFCNFIIIKGAGDFSSVSNFYRISSWEFYKKLSVDVHRQCLLLCSAIMLCVMTQGVLAVSVR